MLASGTLFSQVGINTPAPKATYDITAKSATGISTVPEGLLVPRVSRQKAQSMTDVTISTLIYVNDIASGSQTGTAQKVDAVGYYYFDGTIWTKISSGGFTGKNTNIYSTNGTLTGNRTASQGNRTMAFTGTSANAFSVDGSTFSINAANHRVGIGTTAPTNKLVVKGVNAQPSYTNATLRIDGNTNHALDFGTFADSSYGSYISSNNKSDTAMPLILNPLGSNVGIGTTNPSSSAVLDLASINRGFLPPRLSTAQRDAINPKPAGLMIFNTTNKCMENWNTTNWVSKCSGTINELKCSTAQNNGTLTSGVAASGVTSVISYTGGNGGSYSAQSISSTGVIGLTAKINAGNFANGSGNLTYTITGTPTSTGYAYFEIKIGGRICSIIRTVVAKTPEAPTIACNGIKLRATSVGASTSGYVKGKNIIATLTSATNVMFNAGSLQASCNLNRSEFASNYGMSNNSSQNYFYHAPSSLTYKFNQNISNLLLSTSTFGGGSTITITLKKNGYIVSGATLITGCTSPGISLNGMTITDNRNLMTTGFGDSNTIIGGIWFDEVTISTNGLNWLGAGIQPPQTRTVIMMCINDAQ